MKPYTLHKFQVCQLTGSTLIEASYNVGDGTERVQKMEFTNAVRALAYVRGEAHIWFTNALKNFVFHKEHIYSDKASLQACSLKFCREELQTYYQLHIFEVVSRFLKHKAHFEAILPNASNNSYESSVRGLNDMIQFAKTFSNLKLQTQ